MQSIILVGTVGAVRYYYYCSYQDEIGNERMNELGRLFNCISLHFCISVFSCVVCPIAVCSTITSSSSTEAGKAVKRRISNVIYAIKHYTILILWPSRFRSS